MLPNWVEPVAVRGVGVDHAVCKSNADRAWRFRLVGAFYRRVISALIRLLSGMPPVLIDQMYWRWRQPIKQQNKNFTLLVPPRIPNSIFLLYSPLISFAFVAGRPAAFVFEHSKPLILLFLSTTLNRDPKRRPGRERLIIWLDPFPFFHLLALFPRSVRYLRGASGTRVSPEHRTTCLSR